MMTTTSDSTTKETTTVKAIDDLLANCQIFYQNLQGLHWNIEGILFFELHKKYEKLYDYVGNIADELAERIRAFDETPTHTFSKYLEMSDIEEVSDVKDGSAGVAHIIESLNTIIEKEKKLMELAKKDKDEATLALVSAYVLEQEKCLWMFSSYAKA